MLFLFELAILSLLFPLASSFRVIAPSSVTIGKSATVKWIRQNGDTSSFSLMLRRDSQDRGGVIIKTIRSTGESQGEEPFTTDEETLYLIQIITDLQPLRDDQQPANILATSDKITAVPDSNPPQQGTTQRSSSSSLSRTTTQTTPPPTNTGTNRGSDSNNNNGGNAKTEGPASDGGADTAAPVSSPFVGSSTSVGAAIETTSQSQGPQDTASSLVPETTAFIPTGGTPADSSTPPPPSPTSTGEPPTSGATSKKANVGVIVGAAFGGLVFLFLIFFLLFLYNRRKRRQQTLEYAFRRDLMVRNMEPADRSFSFHSVSPSTFNTPGPTSLAPKMSYVSAGGFTTYQKYWENQPMPDNSQKQDQDQKEKEKENQTENPNPAAPVHESNPSTSTYASSSSLSVFYTAVPKAFQTPPPQPALAPGFTFPSRAPSVPNTPTPTTTTSTSTKTDRQIAIQTKMEQLRARLVVLQSRSARGSGFTDESRSASEESASEREEVGKIREELDRLGEIMNSGWAMRRTESGGDVPAGLKA